MLRADYQLSKARQHHSENDERAFVVYFEEKDATKPVVCRDRVRWCLKVMMVRVQKNRFQWERRHRLWRRYPRHRGDSSSPATSEPRSPEERGSSTTPQVGRMRPCRPQGRQIYEVPGLRRKRRTQDRSSQHDSPDGGLQRHTGTRPLLLSRHQ